MNGLKTKQPIKGVYIKKRKKISGFCFVDLDWSLMIDGAFRKVRERVKLLLFFVSFADKTCGIEDMRGDILFERWRYFWKLKLASRAFSFALLR